MNEIPTIITERVDDIPLLLEQRQRMGLPTWFDTYFPTHGNWTGLSLGWVSTIWLSAIVSRGDHRMVHVAPWVAKRLWTLGATTGQAVTRVDFPDDRLEIVLRRLSEAPRPKGGASYGQEGTPQTMPALTLLPFSGRYRWKLAEGLPQTP